MKFSSPGLVKNVNPKLHTYLKNITSYFEGICLQECLMTKYGELSCLSPANVIKGEGGETLHRAK